MATPPVSFLLTTYNHGPFVEEAVRSVLAQDWDEPMQVHISDDCSTDDTWERLQAALAEYDGPFDVSAHRNTKNMGAMSHTEEALARCEAPYIVRGHGDDVQLPQRVARVMAAFRDKGALLVSSNAQEIDADGTLGKLILPAGGDLNFTAGTVAQAGWTFHMLGATYSLSRKYLDAWGWLTPELMASGGDHVLPFRAALQGGFHYLGEPLLRWRRHPGQVTQKIADPSRDPHIYETLHELHSLAPAMQRLRDLRRAVGNPVPEQARPIEQLLVQKVLTQLTEFNRKESILRRQGLRLDWVAKD